MKKKRSEERMGCEEFLPKSARVRRRDIHIKLHMEKLEDQATTESDVSATPVRRQDALATASSARGRFGDRQLGDGTFRRWAVLATGSFGDGTFRSQNRDAYNEYNHFVMKVS